MKSGSFNIAYWAFFLGMVYIFIIQKISSEGDRLQAFSNICCNFGKICHINVVRFFSAQNMGHIQPKTQQISLGGLIEWETTVYFLPLFVHFKTLLTTLTKSALLRFRRVSSSFLAIFLSLRESGSCLGQQSSFDRNCPHSGAQKVCSEALIWSRSQNDKAIILLF